jgi:ADP-ribose pyrophosphatase
VSNRKAVHPLPFLAISDLVLLASSCVHVIHLKVNLSKPENQNPKPQLEEGEFIDVFSVPLKDLYDEIGRLEAQGFAIDGRVGAFAEGLETAKTWSFFK